MKLGLLSAILADQDFIEVIDTCDEMGFKAVEVACWPKQAATRRYGGVTHLDIAALSKDELKNKVEYAKERGIEISAFAYYPNPLSPVETERETAIKHINMLIDAAADTGVGLVNTFIGRDRFKTVEENLIAYKEIWSHIIDHAEKRNVRIGIENCPMIFSKDEWPGGNNLACTPAIWDEMFRLINSDKLGLNYDPSHMVILDMDYIKPIYTYKDKIFHVHLKDTHIFREKLDKEGRMAYPLKFMEPKLPGLGDINWAQFLSALYDIEYNGCVCIEVEDKKFETDLNSIKRGIKIAYKNVSKYF